MIGTLFNQRYQIESELGRGGMGVVYHAQDTLLKRAVAVKLLGKASEAALDTEARARLLHEARSAAQLNHPNIVSIYDAGEADGSPFIVMEFVQGESLRTYKLQTFDEIIEVARQVCQALQHAHEHEIIHRDLKPGNVMLTKDGRVKLTDFGLARSVASRITTDGAFVGTIYYLPPEQAMGKPIDGRTDLYALGVMLYELTTGRLPFDADNPLAIISQHLHAPVVPPSTFRADLPPELERIILRLLAKDPNDRFATAGEMILRLDEMNGAHLAQPGPLAVSETPDAIVLLEKLARGRLIGRHSDVAQLRETWKTAQQGRSRLVLISGEPGVGKTRLAHELAVYAGLNGGIVLQGGCYEYEATTPYLPLIEALRDWVAEQNPDALRVQLGPLASELARLAPEIETKLGGVEPNPSLSPNEERLRLYDHVTRFLQRLAGGHGLLLFIDDIHWADQGTLALLHYLMRNLRTTPLLVLATYREVELDRTHPFADALVEWNRERLALRVQLGRLSRQEVGEFLEALFGQTGISGEFTDAVFKETEGNPFFVEEVIKSLIEQGQIYRQEGRWQRQELHDLTIPQSVKETIGRRLNRLSTACLDVLHTAAALGKRFGFEELAAVSTVDEDQLLDALDEAAAVQLVRAENDGVFVFTHDKIREVLYEELNPIRRRRLHRRIGEGLERLLGAGDSCAECYIQDLAHHFVEAGEYEKGLRYSIRSAEEADRIYAHDEALHYYAHALECVEALDEPELLADLYERMGIVHIHRGSHTQAIENLQQALKLASSKDKRAELNVQIGEVYTTLADERSRPYLQAALDELDTERQANFKARALTHLGRFHHFRTEWDQGVEYYQKALQLAEPLDDAYTLTWLYAYLAGIYQQQGPQHMPTSMDWARRCIQFGQRKNYPLAEALGYEFLAEDAFVVCAWRDAIAYGLKDYEIGERIGSQDRMGWGQASIAHGYEGIGDLPAARTAANLAVEIAERIGDTRLRIFATQRRAQILADLGAREAAFADAEQALALARQINVQQAYNWAIGSLGAVQAAFSEWERLEETSDLWQELIGFDRSDWRLQIAMGLGRMEETASIASQMVETPPGFFPAGQADRWLRLGIAAMFLGNWSKSRQLMDQAQRSYHDYEDPVAEAEVLYWRARLLYLQGEQQAACADLRAALDLLSACSAGRLIDDTQAWLQRLACSTELSKSDA